MGDTAEEFKTLREEIIAQIRLRDQSITTMIIATAAILSWGFSVMSLPNKYLLLAPLVVIIPSAFYYGPGAER